MCNCYYYDRAVHISVAVDMRTLLDRTNFSSRTNGQVAARRVTGLIIKRLWSYVGTSRWETTGSLVATRRVPTVEPLVAAAA